MAGAILGVRPRFAILHAPTHPPTPTTALKYERKTTETGTAQPKADHRVRYRPRSRRSSGLCVRQHRQDSVGFFRPPRPVQRSRLLKTSCALHPLLRRMRLVSILVGSGQLTRAGCRAGCRAGTLTVPDIDLERASRRGG